MRRLTGLRRPAWRSEVVVRDRQRTIQIADFELPRGSVSIEQLMAMPRTGWDHLRREINLRRQQDRSQPLAKCRLCEGGVYIRSQATQTGHVPMYAHFPEASKDCPWYGGGNLRPDDARAAQYQGHQESALHRRLCVRLEELAKLDSRCLESSVNTYLRPAIHARGRWPDVYAVFDGLGRFALEVQLSKPFAPEIAARHLHYEAEGVKLVWIFHALEDPMPQGFHDVVTMQRGNAFIFDEEAEFASIERGTIVLKCLLEDGQGGWLLPRLVALDDLQTGSGRSVFLEDRRSDLLEAWCKKERDHWWKALREARQLKPDWPFYSDALASAWEALALDVPGLPAWEAEFWAVRSDRARAHTAMLFAILSSVAHSAEKGAPVLHITKFKGENAVLQMLNSKLMSGDFRHCGRLIEVFLSQTALSPLLVVESLTRKLAEAADGDVQIGVEHPLWQAMARLFPEVFNGVVRAELQDLGRLPRWALPAGML